MAVVSRGEFFSRGKEAAALLRASALWLRHKTIFLFLSLNSEIDTQPLLEAALKEGKKVFAPGIEGERLVFYPVSGADGPWLEGPYGIREPGERRPPIQSGIFTQNRKPGEGRALESRTAIEGRESGGGPSPGGAAEAGNFPALILAPGLAFDKEGNRLGRGKGYYDRFFGELDEAGRKYTALGFCMDFQLADKVPAAGHDKKMNAVVTEKKLYVITQAGLPARQPGGRN